MNQSLKVAGTAVLGVGIGFAIGYKVTEKRLAARFEERLETETAGMKEFYTNVKQKYETPEEAAAALIPQPEEGPKDPRVNHQKIQYHKIVKDENYVGDPLDEFAEGCEIDETVIRKNVFDDQPVGKPCLINQDDFMANETGYEQATLTFYAKGGVLTDQRDEVIDNAVDVVGESFSQAFGEGSSDPNTVHVRNNNLQMEFEVVKSERSYEEDVLGQEPTG